MYFIFIYTYSYVIFLLLKISKTGKLKIFLLSGALLKMFQFYISVVNKTSTFLEFLSWWLEFMAKFHKNLLEENAELCTLL